MVGKTCTVAAVYRATITGPGVVKVVGQILGIVCRYSTGQGVSGSDARFQMYYETQCQNPVRTAICALCTLMAGRSSNRLVVAQSTCGDSDLAM